MGLWDSPVGNLNICVMVVAETREDRNSIYL